MFPSIKRKTPSSNTPTQPTGTMTTTSGECRQYSNAQGALLEIMDEFMTDPKMVFAKPILAGFIRNMKPADVVSVINKTEEIITRLKRANADDIQS